MSAPWLSLTKRKLRSHLTRAALASRESTRADRKKRVAMTRRKRVAHPHIASMLLLSGNASRNTERQSAQRTWLSMWLRKPDRGEGRRLPFRSDRDGAVSRTPAPAEMRVSRPPCNASSSCRKAIRSDRANRDVVGAECRPRPASSRREYSRSRVTSDRRRSWLRPRSCLPDEYAHTDAYMTSSVLRFDRWLRQSCMLFSSNTLKYGIRARSDLIHRLCFSLTVIAFALPPQAGSRVLRCRLRERGRLRIVRPR